MNDIFYSNPTQEENLRNKIMEKAVAKFGNPLPSDAEERIITELTYLSENSSGTCLAAASHIAEFSESKGYPVSFRNLTGSLFLAYLLDMIPENPMDYGIIAESNLGANGRLNPSIYMNLASSVYPDVPNLLSGLFPDCNIAVAPMYPAQTAADTPADCCRICLLPKDVEFEMLSEDERPLCTTLHLFSHATMDTIGLFQRFTRMKYCQIDVTNPELLHAVCSETAKKIPEFQSGYFQRLAKNLPLENLGDLARIMGICHTDHLWVDDFFAIDNKNILPVPIGTKEDVYDICRTYGMSHEDSLTVMEAVRRGKGAQILENYRETFRQHDIPLLFNQSISRIRYLFSRGQNLNYAHWSLVQLWYELWYPEFKT